MTKKNKKNEIEYLILYNNNHGNSVKLNPQIGGSIRSLTLANELIIKEPKSQYNDAYFSSILFPFVNRVENGTFSFQDITYKLPLNDVNKENAIHGLIYDKKFEIKGYELSKEEAFITLSHSSVSSTKIFPFDYTIDLTYQITRKSLILGVSIYNKGLKSFPFNIGWHPFFYNSTKENRKLKILSDQKVVFNDLMIPTSFNDFETNELVINRHFDDCYRLKKGEVNYYNANYNLLLTSTSEMNYLQIFTPPDQNSVAIEFMTSPPNSFNNRINMNVLGSKKKYNIKWSINLLTEK